MKYMLRILRSRFRRTLSSFFIRSKASPQAIPLLKEVGLSETRPGKVHAERTRTRYFIKIGKWYVRLDFILWFLRQHPHRRSLLKFPIRVLTWQFAEDSHLARCGVLRIKESVAKVSLFCLGERRKIAIWASRSRMRKELRGASYFRINSPKTRRLSIEGVDSAIQQEFTCDLFGRARVKPSEIAKLIIEAHEVNAPGPRISWDVFLTRTRRALRSLAPHLAEAEYRKLCEVLARLERLPEGPCQAGLPLGWSHNDLGPEKDRNYDSASNVITQSNIFQLLDFDQGYFANIWYDLIYLYCSWENVPKDLLAEWVSTLSSRLSLNIVVDDDFIDLLVDLFKADFARYLAKTIHLDGKLHETRMLWFENILRGEIMMTPAQPSHPSCTTDPIHRLRVASRFDRPREESPGRAVYR